MSTLALALGQACLVGSVSLSLALSWLVCLPKWVPHRVAFSTLLGICSIAWLVQCVYLFGGNATFALGGATVIIVATLSINRDHFRDAIRDLAPQLFSYAIFFVVCLLSTSLQVWPAAGPWSTDWVVNYMQMELVWNSEPLSEWLLARPLLFPSIGVTFLGVMQPLAAFQLSLCAANAAALLCVLSFAQSFLTNRLKLLPFVILFCASPFFLVNFTSFVPKFVQAALIIGAFLMMRGGREHMISRMALSSLLLAFAMECHHSTIAYVPAIAMGWMWVGWPRLSQFVRGVVVATLIGGLLIFTPELRKISLYGLEEIAKYNPSKAMRSPEPAWFVLLMTLECKLLGYQFLVPPYIWVKDTYLGAAKPLEHYIHWFWFVWMSVLSNTIVFMLLPFLFTWNRASTYLGILRNRVPAVFVVGGSIAILINCLLNPYYISGGNVHCGSTAIALTLMILAIAWVNERSEFLTFSGLATLVLGCLPWVVWQCVQFSKVVAEGGYKISGEVMDDNRDLPALLSISQEPWGYAAWPWLPLVLMLVLSTLLFVVRDSPSGEETRAIAA